MQRKPIQHCERWRYFGRKKNNWGVMIATSTSLRVERQERENTWFVSQEGKRHELSEDRSQ